MLALLNKKRLIKIEYDRFKWKCDNEFITFIPGNDTKIEKDYVAGDQLYKSGDHSLIINNENNLINYYSLSSCVVYKNYKDHTLEIDQLLDFIELFLKDPNIAMYYASINRIENKFELVSVKNTSIVYGISPVKYSDIIRINGSNICEKEYSKIFVKLCKFVMDEPQLIYVIQITPQDNISSNDIIFKINRDSSKLNEYKELMHHLDLLKNKSYVEYLHHMSKI